MTRDNDRTTNYASLTVGGGTLPLTPLTPLGSGEFRIVQAGRVVLTITRAGELVIAPGVAPAETAQALYDAWQGIVSRAAR